MGWISSPEMWVALATLTLLEIVLGIDNIVFISILSNKLPAHQQRKARLLGLGLAMIMRVLLLLSLAWVMRLTDPLFAVLGHEISGRDLILILGGLFLIAKATSEIHDRLEGEEGHTSKKVRPSLASVLIQIALLDIVFSLDSVITAVGMVDEIGVMVTAVVIAIIFMMAFAGTISQFVGEHPTVKMLALSFLLLIGVMLVVEGFDQHIPRGYIYFAMGFSVFVEILNLRVNRARRPVILRTRISPTEETVT